MTEAINEMRTAGDWDDTVIPRAIIDEKGDEVAPSLYLPGVVLRRRLPLRGGGGVLDNDAPGSSYTPDFGNLVAPIRPAPEGYIWASEEMNDVVKPGEE